MKKKLEFKQFLHVKLNFNLKEKIYQLDNNNLTLAIFLLNNTTKLFLQYLFHVVVLFYTVFNLKLDFKLKYTKKVYYKNLKKLKKKISKTSGHPVIGKLSIKTISAYL